ncbi:MAG: ComF family protein [Bacteroidales bacterium]|nr:ComF family protein [Bacteroidales bacterium]
MRNEQVLCLPCMLELPRTGFHADPENDVARMFWGRVPVEHATAFMYFYKDSRYRQILHELKYRGQCHVGVEMGRIFGSELKSTPFEQVDLVHPVPLHRRKQRKRGYNQSALIAKGVAEVLGKPMEAGLIRRTVNTDTQTRKSRYERWENVAGIFSVKDPERLKDRHVLLVDDVVTTGSTLEACAAALIDLGHVRVSVAVLAYVKLD